MALSEAGIGAIGGAANSLLGTITGIFTQKANRKENQRIRAEDRQWALEDYDRQKADNIAMWQMENEYNSPDQQRRRLEEAGYNPALALGDVNSAGSAGSISSAEAPSSPNQGAYEMTAPPVDFAGGFSQILGSLSQIEGIKGQQLDNYDKSQRNVHSGRRYKQDVEAQSAMIQQIETGIFLDTQRARLVGLQHETERRLHELQTAQLAQVEQETSESVARESMYGAQATNLASQTDLNNQYLSESQSREKQIAEEVLYLENKNKEYKTTLSKLDRMIESNIGQTIAQTGLLEEQTYGHELENDVLFKTGSNSSAGGAAGALTRQVSVGHPLGDASWSREASYRNRHGGNYR